MYYSHAEAGSALYKHSVRRPLVYPSVAREGESKQRPVEGGGLNYEIFMIVYPACRAVPLILNEDLRMGVLKCLNKNKKGVMTHYIL